jgi:hypothetical protein
MFRFLIAKSSSLKVVYGTESLRIDPNTHRDLLFKWLQVAWQRIPADLVKASFKKCGLTNALDGTEDDLISFDINRPTWLHDHDDSTE